MSYSSDGAYVPAPAIEPLKPEAQGATRGDIKVVVDVLLEIKHVLEQIRDKS